MRVDSKPEWVPDEAWERRKNHGGLREIVLAKSCKSLWETVTANADRVPVAHAVIEIVGAIRQGLHFQAPVLNRDARKRHERKVLNAVSKINAELDAMSGEAGALPVIIDLQLSWLDGSPLQGVEPVDHRFRELLVAFAEATKVWAATKPVISHTESDHAPRLVMIRNLTRVFVSLYGKPMRSQVIAVVEVFYGPSDLDPQTVNKLAPVSAVYDNC